MSQYCRRRPLDFSSSLGLHGHVPRHILNDLDDEGRKGVGAGADGSEGHDLDDLDDLDNMMRQGRGSNIFDKMQNRTE